MSEPRAQRTLVKSPPELWAEISDVSMLARHLGEFGDIRITRLEAETTVVWEGDRARGTVELEASGWGTKVTITAEAIAVAEAEVGPPEAQVGPIPEAQEEEAPPVAAAEAESAPEPEPEPDPEPAFAPDLGEDLIARRRRGFFARLFTRKGPEEPATAPVPEAPAAAAPEPEPAPAAELEPQPAAVEEPVLDGEIVATAAEALDDDHVEAVLVSVLDDLGSAHHRPFSRG